MQFWIPARGWSSTSTPDTIRRACCEQAAAASISTRAALSLASCRESSTSSGTVTLNTGDDLVLYTDGVTEAMNGDEEMFGEERLEELLVAHRHKSARDIEEHVYTEIRDFAAGAAQADDLTMVVVKRFDENTPSDRENNEKAFSSSDSPREAIGGSSAAQGASDSDRLGGPATAAPAGLAIEGVG